MPRLSEQVILITGCSSGIGRALALALAERGHRVIATARRPDSIADLTHANIDRLPLDVTSAGSIETAVGATLERHGRIDMLVNNAGYGLIGPVAELSLDDLRLQFETNVIGAIALIQAVVPIMARQAFGRIVNIGSVSGITATPFSGAYCGSKAALHLLSDSLRMEVEPLGIDVVVVRPGGIRSEFAKNADKALDRYDKPGSLYAPVYEGIKQRAQMSQQDKSTPVEEFVNKISDVITKKTAPAVYYCGYGSTTLPALSRWFPTKPMDHIMQKRFQLDRLNKS